MKNRFMVAALFLPLLLCCLAIGAWFYQEENAGSEYDGIREEVSVPDLSVEENDEGSEAEPETLEETEVEYQSPINFTELKKEYPDAYAWIHIDDTRIDYPIMQHPTDDSYYLSHSADGTPSKAGAIFTETLNSKTFTDPNTVVYGHNMRNGSMFRTLHKFEDRDFFDSHDEILIYTPTAEIHFKIFAAYKFDNRHLLSHINFWDPEVYAAYLEDIRSQNSPNAYVRTDVPVSKDNCILTLSTCTGDPDRRYIVQAVQTSYIVDGLIQ